MCTLWHTRVWEFPRFDRIRRAAWQYGRGGYVEQVTSWPGSKPPAIRHVTYDIMHCACSALCFYPVWVQTMKVVRSVSLHSYSWKPLPFSRIFHYSFVLSSKTVHIIDQHCDWWDLWEYDQRSIHPLLPKRLWEKGCTVWVWEHLEQYLWYVAWEQ